MVKNIIKTHHIKGIISDNRFGVYSSNIKTPSVYITHQLRVFSGITTWISTKLHQNIIKEHHECWIPDFETIPNLSGKLGHIENPEFKIKYIGPLSRFDKISIKSIYDIMVLLSGPEPQRTILEEKVLHELKDYKGNTIVIQGLVQSSQKVSRKNNLTIYNFMQSTELEKAIQSSDVIISRSGYTTIMDLAKLKKKAFFRPTPGQNEQLYLAKRLEKLNIAPYCKQKDFSVEKLKELNDYKGFNTPENYMNFSDLFSLFERE